MMGLVLDGFVGERICMDMYIHKVSDMIFVE